MNKLEFELEKLRVWESSERRQARFDFFSTGLVLGTVVICVWIIADALVRMSQGRADSIDAMAHVVKALDLSQITSYLVAVMGGGFGYYERRGKRRAIERLDKLQKQLEGNDPYRGSSHLTPQGDTPKRSR